MNMDISDGLQIIAKALEEVEKERAWEMWLTEYPNMNADNFISFSDYHKLQTTPIKKMEKRSEQEKLNEIEMIRKKFYGG